MFIVSKPSGAHCDHKPARREAGLWKVMRTREIVFSPLAAYRVHCRRKSCIQRRITSQCP